MYLNFNDIYGLCKHINMIMYCLTIKFCNLLVCVPGECACTSKLYLLLKTYVPNAE